MSDDPADGGVLLFGGFDGDDPVGDTWIWNGTDWTQRFPAHAPKVRYGMGMAYDAANDQVTLFGGRRFNDTWTWDGADWTDRTIKHAPAPYQRNDLGLAYDAGHSQVVLFGGCCGDTWTWNGSAWTQHPAVSTKLGTRKAPPGASISLSGWGFLVGEKVKISFIDSVHGTTVLTKVATGATSEFFAVVTIPANATPGGQQIKAKGLTSGAKAIRIFTVT
jgi:hypothetical protein